MTTRIITHYPSISGKEFVQLALANGYQSYQEIADRFNNSKIDLINRWMSRGGNSPDITCSGLYAIAKDQGWLDGEI